MGVRTGAEFIAGLRDNREVWLGNERVVDVTAHPAFRGAIESLARLYDMQHEPTYRDLLTYPSPTTGDPVGLSFLIPRTREDLACRRRMIKTWADATCGMMGRSADFLNTMVMAWAAKRDYFAQQSPACAERVWHYYESCREQDLFLTHALIDPQVDRPKNRAEQDDPYLCLRIVEETTQGLIVRGAKMVATAAPASAWDPAARIKDQDRDGVQAEVIYTTLGMPLYGLDDVEPRTACFRAYNDWAVEYCSYDPKRLLPLGLITLEDIAAGVAELKRIAKKGRRGAMIWAEPPEERPYSHPDYDPFTRLPGDQIA